MRDTRRRERRDEDEGDREGDRRSFGRQPAGPAPSGPAPSGPSRGGGISLSGLLHDVRFFACDDITAAGCSDDPDACRPGDVFVATLTGERDGHDHVERALARGVAGVVAERIVPTSGRPLCIVPDSNWALARLHHAFAGDPARKMHVIAITGTSGKTTTAWLAAAVLSEAGLRVGVLSDLGCLTADDAEPVLADLSRPELLADWFRRMNEDRCTHVVIEVSSSMLAGHCLAGVCCDTVAVTNLGVAHLDMHGTQAAYHAVKSRILDCVGPNGCLVANADDERVGRLLGKLAASPTRPGMISVGLTADADVTAAPVERSLFGQTFLVQVGGHAAPVAVATPVASFVRDSLLAVAIGLRYRVPLERIVRGIESCGSVSGRLERIDRGQDHAVFVDHPTSGHALASTLTSLRRLTRGRLVVLAETGCAVRLVADICGGDEAGRFLAEPRCRASGGGDPDEEGVPEDGVPYEEERPDAARLHTTFNRRTSRWADDCLIVPDTLLDDERGEDAGGWAANVTAYASIDRLLASLVEQDCLLVLGNVRRRCLNPIDPDGEPVPLAAVVDGWLQLAHGTRASSADRHAA